MSGHSSNGDDFSDYDYDMIPMPDEVGTIGIMDSPFYDCRRKSLYFVDLFKKNMYRYSEEDNRVYYCSVSQFTQPSFILPARGKDNTYVVGFNESTWVVSWDGVSTLCSIVKKFVTPDNEAGHQTNSACAGPKGSLYWGYLSSGLCGESDFVSFSCIMKPFFLMLLMSE